jgi:hypothetical protein
VVESNVTIRNVMGLVGRRSDKEEEGCSKEVKASLEICCESNQSSGRALLTLLANDRGRLQFSCHHFPGRRKMPPVSEGPVVWFPVALEWPGDLPSLESSVTAMSMNRSFRGCSEESTGSETKGGHLMGVSNLTIKKNNWTVWHMR